MRNTLSFAFAVTLAHLASCKPSIEETANSVSESVSYFRIRNRNGYDLCFAEFTVATSRRHVTYVPCKDIDPALIFDTGPSQSR